MSEKTKEIGRLVLGIVLLLFGMTVISAIIVRWFLDPSVASDQYQRMIAFIYLCVGIFFSIAGGLDTAGVLSVENKTGTEKADKFKEPNTSMAHAAETGKL